MNYYFAQPVIFFVEMKKFVLPLKFIFLRNQFRQQKRSPFSLPTKKGDKVECVNVDCQKVNKNLLRLKITAIGCLTTFGFYFYSNKTIHIVTHVLTSIDLSRCNFKKPCLISERQQTLFCK